MDAATSVFVAIVLVAAACILVWALIDLASDLCADWRERRAARIEAELDAKSEQLRKTILELAEELAQDRDEASRQLTRAMFLTIGHTAPKP
jgi:F0F1-type ATP synthase membrane subunit b/b'